MSFLVGEIVARVRADKSQFTRDMGSVRRQGTQATNQVQRGFKGVGGAVLALKPIIASAFTGAIVMGARKAVREFAFLEGAMAKFEVVFGQQAEEMEAWVNTFREGVPLARREIIQAAASMQDLLIPMGIAREEGTAMTKEWLELAAALAAFNDVPVDQALEAIRSGIAGQSRPLRQFGIDARETAIQQTAIANGLMKAGEEMTEQTRQQALLMRAYEQSTDAINGYEDQLGTTLMLEQELGAKFKDTQAAIGEGLQPAYNALLEDLIRLLSIVKNLNSEFDTFKNTIISIAQAQGSWQIIGRFRDVIKVVNALTNDSKTLNETWNDFLSLPIDQFNIENVSKQIDATAKAMDAMLQRRFERGLDTEAVRASEAYQELQGRLMTLMAIVENLKDTSDSFNDSLDETEEKKPEKPFVEANKHAQDLSKTLFEIESQISSDIFSEMFPFGSIASINNQIDILSEKLKFETSDEERAALLEQIRQLRAELERINALGIKEVEDASDDVEDKLNDATGAARFFSTTLGDGLTNAIFQAQKLEDVFKNIARQLASRALSTLIMGGLTGGFGDQGFFGAMFGGFRQSGGAVSAGNAYVVGEQGPELFLPNSGGAIISNDQLQGSQINPALIGMAFERALDKKLEALPPRAIYALSERGRLDY